VSKKTDDELKQRVIQEWDTWAKEHVPAGGLADGHHAWLFFLRLQKDRLQLLPSAHFQDPWQTVHGWLLHAGKVKD
jgi:hypothetical protein